MEQKQKQKKNIYILEFKEHYLFKMLLLQNCSIYHFKQQIYVHKRETVHSYEKIVCLICIH